jgi:hypothetical protein
MNSSNRSVLAPVLAAAAAWLLAGCSYSGGSDVLSIYQYAKALAAPAPKVSLQEAASSPFASLGVRLGDGPESMMLLVSNDGNHALWTSADRVAITTENGRIVRTAGLGHDLGGLVLRRESKDGGIAITQWNADFPELGLYSVPITCHGRVTGEEAIVILGKAVRTVRTDETCESANEKLAWSFTNTFWRARNSGRVWRSVQYINPRLDPIETEILRPQS